MAECCREIRLAILRKSPNMSGCRVRAGVRGGVLSLVADSSEMEPSAPGALERTAGAFFFDLRLMGFIPDYGNRAV
jgi:hypothetical protein